MSTNLEITPRVAEVVTLLHDARQTLIKEGVWENLEQLGDWCPAKVGRERDELRAEVERLRKALNEIADLCQLTCVTFEQQSFRATRIAREALAGKEGDRG
jgi:hypothetical protein